MDYDSLHGTSIRFDDTVYNIQTSSIGPGYFIFDGRSQVGQLIRNSDGTFFAESSSTGSVDRSIADLEGALRFAAIGLIR
ncbi:MAG: hypothetical protein ACTH31_13245 [Pseudoclavibacter sp.]